MFPENVLASQQAYEQAGVKDPVNELDHVQLHDAFTVNELVDYEDVGLAPRGKAPTSWTKASSRWTASIPVNTDGGLKCTGHPVPATGLKQLAESYHQVQGTAGPRQVKDARLQPRPQPGRPHRLLLAPSSPSWAARDLSSAIARGGPR